MLQMPVVGPPGASFACAGCGSSGHPTSDPAARGHHESCGHTGGMGGARAQNVLRRSLDKFREPERVGVCWTLFCSNHCNPQTLKKVTLCELAIWVVKRQGLSSFSFFFFVCGLKASPRKIIKSFT